MAMLSALQGRQLADLKKKTNNDNDIKSFVDEKWENSIVSSLEDYIRIPNVCSFPFCLPVWLFK
jgi:hypothetical protein